MRTVALIFACRCIYKLGASALVSLVLVTGLYAIPFDARVNAVVADPAEPNRLYASSIGGILRSEDRGKTWEQIPVFPLGQRQPSFQKVQFDPANSATIYAVATGDLSEPLSGIWRSYDRGAHWDHLTPAGTFLEGSALTRVLVAPSNGSVLYAVTSAGSTTRTYRSSNAGSTWTVATQTEVLAVSPTSPDTIYRGGVYQIYRSTNGGANWTQIGQTKESSGLNGINGIAISPANPDLMIASVGGSSSNLVGIYRSTSGGQGTWTQITTGSAVGGAAFNPKNPTQVIVGDCCSLSLHYSSNSGQSFAYLPDDTGEFTSRLQLSPANVSFDPSPNGFLLHAIVRADNNGGVAERTSAAAKWKRLAGTYTPSAVASAELKSAKVLSDDTSVLVDSLKIESAEGSPKPGFTLAGTISTAEGVSANVTEDGSDPQSPVIEFGLRRSAKGLGPGVYVSTTEVPVRGALNDKVYIPTSLEVAEKPETPGVYLGRGIPVGMSTSVDGVALHQGVLYVAGFGQINAIDPNGSYRRVVGKGYGNSGEGGPALNAEIGFTSSLTVAPNGTIYFVDWTASVVRAVTTDGIIRTVAGSITGSSSIPFATQQVPASSVSVGSSTPLATRADSSLVLGISGKLWHLDGTVLRAITGTTNSAAPTDGALARNVNFTSMVSIARDPNGLLVVATTRQVFRINNAGTLEHLAGSNSSGSVGPDAKGTAFTINAIGFLKDRLLIVDGNTATLRRVDPDFSVHHVGFNGRQGTPSGCSGATYVPRPSSLTYGLAATEEGMVYVGSTTLPRFWIPLPAEAGGSIPSVPSEGIVNAASFGREISPGSLVSVFGSDVAAQQTAAPSLPLPAQLGGGVACIDSQVAPQIFASPLQVNVQVPFGLEPGTRTARFFNAHGGTAPVSVEVQASSPEVFRDHNNRGIIINPDGGLNGPGAAAAPGEYVVVYLTGIGDVEPAVATGSASPADPLARPKQEYRATVGGADRSLYFLGLSPGFAGLAQANLEVPQLSPGEHDLTITVGGHTSQTVKLTVK